jgi:hypothetical protein
VGVPLPDPKLFTESHRRSVLRTQHPRPWIGSTHSRLQAVRSAHEITSCYHRMRGGRLEPWDLAEAAGCAHLRVCKPPATRGGEHLLRASSTVGGALNLTPGLGLYRHYADDGLPIVGVGGQHDERAEDAPDDHQPSLTPPLDHPQSSKNQSREAQSRRRQRQEYTGWSTALPED